MKKAENFDFDVRQVMSLACRAMDEKPLYRIQELESRVCSLEVALREQQRQMGELQKQLAELREDTKKKSEMNQYLRRELGQRVRSIRAVRL